MDLFTDTSADVRMGRQDREWPEMMPWSVNHRSRVASGGGQKRTAASSQAIRKGWRKSLPGPGITISKPKRSQPLASAESYWLEQERDGFTAKMAHYFETMRLPETAKMAGCTLGAALKNGTL